MIFAKFPSLSLRNSAICSITRGCEYVGVVGYVGRHGRLPDLDWAMVVAFIGIAGAGGLCNTLFSNYARDKGWGMGAWVSAIPTRSVAGQSVFPTRAACFPWMWIT